MKYKIYDVAESIQIDILSPGSEEKIDEYILPKNVIDIFMLLKNTIDDEVMRLHSIINKDSEYVDTPNADILNTISHAITEHKRIDAEFNERKKAERTYRRPNASEIDIYKR